ncbi:MAG: N-acetylmuramoyl-L-alanine amidase [candidate division Zixibacteria bacterium]|nr:N-acetylmuramoyl-L-alanine amidase [candidate division Zixibacteria bacterium]
MPTILRTAICAVTLSLILLIPALATETVDVTISGETQKIHSFHENKITYVSYSELVELLGGTLDWEIVGHQVSYIEGVNRFDFVLGSPFFKLNNKTYNLTYPAIYRDGQLFLPIETFCPFLNGALPQKVTWSTETSGLRIDSQYFNVTDLTVSPKANGLLIEVLMTTSLPYEIYLTEGNWLNISITEARINSSRILSRRDPRTMYKLTTHQAAGSGQISMRLRRNVEKWSHKLAYDPPRIQISIADTRFAFDSADSQPQVGPDDKIDVIVIDPGHGGGDYGAIGPGGTREKDVVLDISRELARLIRKDKQFKVIMTRDRDKTMTLEQRADIANTAGADLFISVHANASTKSRVRGWNVFFLAPAKNDSARAVAQFENSVFLREQSTLEDHREVPDDELTDNPILTILNEMIMTEFQVESHDFAMMAAREFRRRLKIPARGVDQAGFFVLNMVFTPSVLIEAGFISNKKEERLLKSSKYQKQVAAALYDAIKKFKAKYEQKGG